MTKKTLLRCIWFSAIAVFAFIVKGGCGEKRNYTLHPATDEEIEYEEAIHNRGG